MIAHMKAGQLIPLTPSSLKYEQQSHTSELGTSFALWKVVINDLVFSDVMTPFSASDSSLERFGCLACGEPGDGHGQYLSRRAGDFVLWICAELFDSDSPRGLDNLPEIHAFASEAYEKTLDGGKVADLPEITPDEISIILNRYLPQPSIALYVEPLSCQDPRGKSVLDQLRKSICGRSGALQLIKTRPQSVIEYKVGLDLPGVPECRWLVGEVAQGKAVLFLSWPTLPVWICIDA
jgi:hypothetical protein